MKLANYELLDIIGEGGFGLVYKAKQLSTDQMVAIKVLKFDSHISEQKQQHQIARFQRETQLSARLNHPNIVKLLDKGTTEDNRMYAVFEYVEGQTLKELIIERNGLSPQVTGELMGQILDGLASAHAQGIVHRDLKPTNIMVTKTGLKEHAKILDFGIGAFTASFQPKDYAMLTLTKETIGTPAYSAPEQLRGEPPTTKSDLYAWGLILLECLTGAPVMRGESVGEVFEQQLNANQVPLPSAITEHPLGKLLRNVLEKTPLHRSADAQRIAEEYSRINFQTLVGQIQMPQTVITDADVTSVTDFGLDTQKSERRQITVLSVQLSMAVSEDTNLGEEVLDTLQEDQMALTTEISTRYGGYLAGSVADTITVYFGYPHKSENDARYAGRTALELISQAKKRSALLYRQHGIELDMRMGIHSGMVVLKKNTVPKGIIPNTSFALMNRAESDSVLASLTTKTLLDPFLEFESAGEVKLSKFSKPETVFSLKGERASEALSFLRPWSANRKMIGRDAELKLIKDSWRKIDMGHGQAVLVQGQAGIGKSKLIHEAKRQLGVEGVQIKEVRCLPEHRNNALYPFFEMLKKHTGILDLDETSSKIIRLRELLKELEEDEEQMLPILCSWLSIPLDETVTGSQLPPDQQKALLMQTMHALLVHLGKGGKYILTLEDLHWIDPTSLELVETTLAGLPTNQVLMLMTARPEFTHEWAYKGLQLLDLQPLDQDRTRRMILGVLDSASVDDKLVQYVSERADGVPLFIEELTHMLLDREFLILKDDTYRLDETQDMSSVPVRLNDLLNARLDKLGFAKETAQLAASIGREFEYNLLVDVSLKDEAMVQADLDTLAQADMVYHQRRVEGDAYIFRHALIRDAAYESIAQKDRVESHQRVAEILIRNKENGANIDDYLIAGHLAAAQDYVRAVQYALSAVKDSLARSSDQEVIQIALQAEGWYQQIEEENQDPNVLMSLYSLRALALMNTDGWAAPSVAEVTNASYELIRSEGWQKFEFNKVLEVYWTQFTYMHVASQRLVTDQLTQEFLEIADSNEDENLKVTAAVLRGIDQFQYGNTETAIGQFKNALSYYNKYKDAENQFTTGLENFALAMAMYGQSLWHQGTALSAEGNTKEGELRKNQAREMTNQALERAQGMEHKPTLCMMWHYKGVIGQWDNDRQETNKASSEAVKIADKYELLSYQGYAKVMNLWSQDPSKNPEAVIAEIDGILDFLESIGCNLVMSHFRSLPWEFEMALGKKEAAQQRIEKCLALCEANNEFFYQKELLSIKKSIA